MIMMKNFFFLDESEEEETTKPKRKRRPSLDYGEKRNSPKVSRIKVEASSSSEESTYSEKRIRSGIIGEKLGKTIYTPKDVEPNAAQERKWEKWFGKLVEYKKEHGNCLVQRSTNPKLGKWVKTQRAWKVRGWLPQARIDRLNEIHFEWCVSKGLWEQRYEDLLEFKDKYNHTIVPRNKFPVLGNWVRTQRRCLERLSQDRIDKLNAIGFVWKVNEHRMK